MSHVAGTTHIKLTTPTFISINHILPTTGNNCHCLSNEEGGKANQKKASLLEYRTVTSQDVMSPAWSMNLIDLWPAPYVSKTLSLKYTFAAWCSAQYSYPVWSDKSWRESSYNKPSPSPAVISPALYLN